ncbi:MAG TPA: hypothetical protein VG519_02725 [Pseudochrobactrum sp.]|nr:hypothetical protein [Pseudochrobactrum sp.]
MIDIEALKLQTPYDAALKAISNEAVIISDEERERITITDPMDCILFATTFIDHGMARYFLEDWLAGHHAPHYDSYHQWAELKKANTAQE